MSHDDLVSLLETVMDNTEISATALNQILDGYNPDLEGAITHLNTAVMYLEEVIKTVKGGTAPEGDNNNGN